MTSTHEETLVQRLSRLQELTDQESVATCVGCGCDDQRACWNDEEGQACSWLRVDRNTARGVCSTCPEHIERWDAGNTAQAESTDN